MKNKLDIIIPVSLDIDWPQKDEIIRDIKEQYEEYGFTRFALACPCAGWRAIGYPPREFYTERAEVFKQIKEELAPLGIECGWWITLTLKSGKTPGFQSIIKIDGSEHPFANCPLDEAFKKRFSTDVAHFCKIAKPAFVFTEDDFAISSAQGCYCDTHITEFNKRYGYDYTREELKNLFGCKTDEAFAVLRKWRELAKESLVQFAAAIREELDKESPEIPMGYMQAGSADKDGDCTIDVCKAMAGKNHTPFSRLYGASYSGINAREIPIMLYHVLYSKQHIDCDFKYYLEADTFPHTRFYSASGQMIAAMATAFSYGFDGATFQTQQLLDDPNEETAYGKAYAKMRDSFETVSETVKGCELKGVNIPYDPFWYFADPVDDYLKPLWIKSVSRFGIPHTTLESNVIFADETWAKHTCDSEVLAAFCKTLFIDSTAAKWLIKRGYGEYIGIDVGDDVAEVGNRRWDLATREVIKDEFCATRGKNMTAPWMLAPLGNGILPEITVTNPECEVITELYSYKKELICPAMTRFRNKLGGTVIVMGLTIKDNGSQALFNYRRKKLLQNLLINECDDFALIKDAPDVMVVENKATNPKEKGFREMLTVINACEDALDEVAIRLPSDLRDVNCVKILNKKGEWHNADYSLTEDGIIINRELHYCAPMFLTIE